MTSALVMVKGQPKLIHLLTRPRLFDWAVGSEIQHDIVCEILTNIIVDSVVRFWARCPSLFMQTQLW